MSQLPEDFFFVPSKFTTEEGKGVVRCTPRGIRSRRGFVLEGLSYVILANIWECLDVFLDTELYITLFDFVRDRSDWDY